MLLAATGLAGLANGPVELMEARGLPRIVVSLSVTLYGLSGVVASALRCR
jgi:hypothetical protein